MVFKRIITVLFEGKREEELKWAGGVVGAVVKVRSGFLKDKRQERKQQR